MTLQEATSDIGLIGLAVMGMNLILNMADHGYTVTAYNRTVKKVDEFLNDEAKGKSIQGAHSVEELVLSLKKPRRIILLVKAGPPVDEFINLLIPHLEKGDIIIDGGNSFFEDSIRRSLEVEKKGLLYVGCGVSGGEEGARYGPSLMPGGSAAAWPHLKEIFQSISAQVDGTPCCDWVGPNGSGHYVKMVHNGIEYGDMQIIAEVYDILKRGLGLSNDEIADIFEKWNKGVLDSYLIEITYQVLRKKDNDGVYWVDKILDCASQKGTGKWASMNALDLGVDLSLVAEAVFARCVSMAKEERTDAAKILDTVDSTYNGDKSKFIDDLEQAMYAAKIISYSQGFILFREAAVKYDWDLNYSGIAWMWRGGCIIRSVFLGDISNAYKENKNLKSLLFSPFFTKAINKAAPSWRNVNAQATLLGIPIPALSTSLAFFDSYRTPHLPASLIQGQRDFFGAHTFQLLPEYAKGDNAPIHVNWTGHGGNVSASTYNV